MLIRLQRIYHFLHLGVLRGEHNPPGRAWASWRALVGAALLEAPRGAALVHWMSSGPNKILKKFHCVWTPFGINFLRSKKQAKNSNWHWALCQ